MLFGEHCGARLALPRDLQIAYTVGRMGLATAADAGPLFYGSHNTARSGFARLVTLGVLRTFPRTNPASPLWYALSPEAAEWVAAESGAAPGELRVVSGIRRLNLAALGARNRLWVSVVLAARASATVEVVRVAPEWELRRARSPGVGIVPDALFVLAARGQSSDVEPCASMVELDSGAERLAVWVAKAAAYRDLRSRGPLYGASRWHILAVVPTSRRGRTVAEAVVAGGAAMFTWIGVAGALERGHAFEPVLARADALASLGEAAARASLADLVAPGSATVISDPDQPLIGLQQGELGAGRALAGGVDGVIRPARGRERVDPVAGELGAIVVDGDGIEIDVDA